MSKAHHKRFKIVLWTAVLGLTAAVISSGCTVWTCYSMPQEKRDMSIPGWSTHTGFQQDKPGLTKDSADYTLSVSVRLLASPLCQ